MKAASRIILCLVVLVMLTAMGLSFRSGGSFDDMSVTLNTKERFTTFFEGLFGYGDTAKAEEEPPYEDGVYFSFDTLNIPVSNSPVEEGSGSAYILENKDAKLPRITAKTFIVADLLSGDMILARSPNKISPTASVVKLMTALIAAEKMDSKTQIRVDSASLKTEGKAGGFVLGEKLLVSEVISALILVSSNDAAELLARSYGRNDFLVKMSEKAEAIGMKDTSFDDPSGLSYKTVSTANDLFKLIKYISTNNISILNLSRMNMIISVDATRDHTWYNNNPFARKSYDYYAGGKHGYTGEAGYTLASIFSLPISESGSRDIAIILMKSQNIELDVKAIEKYLIDNVKFE